MAGKLQGIQPVQNLSQSTQSSVKLVGDTKKLVESAIARVGSNFMPGTSEGCMLFVRSVLRSAGINAPVTQQPVDGWATGEGYANSLAGKDVGQFIKNINQVQPGDIVFISCTYGDYNCNTITHVGIAVSGGVNGEMIDRPTHDGGVVRRSIDPSLRGSRGKFYGAVRITRSASGSSIARSVTSAKPKPSSIVLQPASVTAATNIMNPGPEELQASVRFPNGSKCLALFVTPTQALMDGACAQTNRARASVTLFGQTAPATVKSSTAIGGMKLAIVTTGKTAFPQINLGSGADGMHVRILRPDDGRWAATDGLLVQIGKDDFQVRMKTSDAVRQPGLVIGATGQIIGVIEPGTSQIRSLQPVPMISKQ